MVFEVGTKFTLPSGNVIKVLISDKYNESLISSSVVEKILQNAKDKKLLFL